MFTRVVVTNRLSTQAICISSKALIFDHSQYFVLIYHGKGIAEIRHVQLLNTIGEKSYLVDGVKVGETVVGSDAILIYDALNN
jgi:cobalt-zinc-cadmium efflux system membrane fusion protein